MKLVPGQFKMNVYKLTSVALLMTITTFVYANTTNSFELRTVFFNSFEAKVNNNTIELSWSVTEYNNKSFQVEHSLNGTDWEDIAYIPSKNSPQSLEDYSYKLSNSITGKHYYRMKYIDVDLRNTGFSKVRIVEIKDESQNITVWPNPSSDFVKIMNNAKGTPLFSKARIFDLAGRLMIEKKLEEGVNTITITSLLPGTYLLYLQNNTGNTLNQKIVKQ
jgi:Secretion system C-terminal sorting domain